MLAGPLVVWALAMRALVPFVGGVLPRLLLALVFAVSPPVLGALASGDVVTLIVAMVLPLLVITVSTILDAAAPVERVWRRLAVSAFLLATAIAFAPPLVIALPVVLAAGVGHALVAVADPRWRRTLIIRTVMLVLLPLPLLGPWLLALPDVLRLTFTTRVAGIGGHPAVCLALDPAHRVLGRVGLVLVIAGLVGAVVVSVATVSVTTFRATIGMLVLAVALPLAGWWLDAAGTSVRPGPSLVIAAAALVGLAALGLQHAPDVLSGQAFGWRQIGVGTVSAAVVLVALAGLLRIAVTGTPELARSEAVPAYLATLSPHPPDRILVLGVEAGAVVWEVVPATGPDLASFGVRHARVIDAAIADAVDDLLSGRDPRAADRLGRLGIGVVLVPGTPGDDALEAQLRIQSALDPLPSLSGSVARVSGGVPGAAIVSGTTPAGRVPDPTVAPRSIVAGIERVAADRFAGHSGAGGDLLVAVPFGSGWRVLVDGEAAPSLSDDGLLRVRAVPPGADVEIVAGASTRRSTLLRAQAFWALLVVSLGARPPALALRNARRRARGAEEVDA
jgi:hypothetical protein